MSVNFGGLMFVRPNLQDLEQMCRITGYTGSTDISSMASWGQGWLTGKHGKLAQDLSDEQRRELLPVLDAMGFFSSLDIRPGHYDDLVVSGLKFPALVKQLKKVRAMLEARQGAGNVYEFGRVIGMFGQRPRTVDMDGELVQIIGDLSNTPRVFHHPWVQDELAKVGGGLFQGPFATEYELGILATLLAYNGDVAVGSDESANDTESLPGIPLRETASCTLTLPDETPMVVLNAPAVQRPKGDPRPTADSSAANWLQSYAPTPNARVVLVAGATHGYRMALDFERRIHQTRGDVSVFCTSHPVEELSERKRLLSNAVGEAFALLKKAAEELTW